MRPIKKIIVHCADTYPNMDIGVVEITKWHTTPSPTDPSKPWPDIGYHDVIRLNGRIEIGRSIHLSGAHAKGHNHDSIGICLVGGKSQDNEPENNFTEKQFKSLAQLIRMYRVTYGADLPVYGHSDFSAYKTCPNFNVKAFLEEHNL
jgi:hypothetical protein